MLLLVSYTAKVVVDFDLSKHGIYPSLIFVNVAFLTGSFSNESRQVLRPSLHFLNRVMAFVLVLAQCPLLQSSSP